MAESTLSLIWQELQGRVGSYLGWGRGAYYGDTAWSSKQQFDLDGIVASGLRRVYRPPPLEGESSSYEWSFLKPVATLTLPISSTTIPLPDDFGGFEGGVIVSTSGGMNWPELPITNIGFILQRAAQYPTTTGRPQMIAQEPLKGTTATAGQRFQLHWWPITDQAYTAKVQYYVLPDYLSTPFPYAYGGSLLSECIMESCLALAEQRLDDFRGLHSAQFMVELAAAVNADRKRKPQALGYNRDLSDQRERQWGPNDRRRWGDFSTITVNGISYAWWFVVACAALWHLAQRGIT